MRKVQEAEEARKKQLKSTLSSPTKGAIAPRVESEECAVGEYDAVEESVRAEAVEWFGVVVASAASVVVAERVFAAKRSSRASAPDRSRASASVHSEASSALVSTHSETPSSALISVHSTVPTRPESTVPTHPTAHALDTEPAARPRLASPHQAADRGAAAHASHAHLPAQPARAVRGGEGATGAVVRAPAAGGVHPTSASKREGAV